MMIVTTEVEKNVISNDNLKCPAHCIQSNPALYMFYNIKGANHAAAVVNSVDAEAIFGKSDAVCLFV